jgi:uncharacterized iron-regulated membrane protein
MVLTKNQTILLLLCIAIPLLLLQANWIFSDARKRGEKHYWLWGLFGLINVPQSLIVYLIVTRIIFKKKNK